MKCKWELWFEEFFFPLSVNLTHSCQKTIENTSQKRQQTIIWSDIDDQRLYRLSKMIQLIEFIYLKMRLLDKVARISSSNRKNIKLVFNWSRRLSQKCLSNTNVEKKLFFRFRFQIHKITTTMTLYDER